MAANELLSFNQSEVSLAAKNNEIHVDNLREMRGEWQPERIVIHNGASLGSLLGTLLVGAAFGAAVATYVLKNRASVEPSPAAQKLQKTERGAARLRNKLTGLSSRVKDLGGRVRDAAQIVNEQVRPAFNDAFRETLEDAKTDKAARDEIAKDELESHPS